MKLRSDGRLVLMIIMTTIILMATVLQILAPRLQQSLLSPSSYASLPPSFSHSGGGGMVSVPATPTLARSPTPLPVVHPLRLDTFQRSAQRGWGTAFDGTVWEGNAQDTPFFIQDEVGQIEGVQGTFSALLGPAQRDSDIVLRGSTTSFEGGVANIEMISRYTNEYNLYKLVLNGATLSLLKRLHGTSSGLACIPFEAKPSTLYTIRLRTVGTRLQAKVWRSNVAEPATWMLTTNDPTFSRGRVGIRVMVQQHTHIRIHFFAQRRLTQ